MIWGNDIQNHLSALVRNKDAFSFNSKLSSIPGRAVAFLLDQVYTSIYRNCMGV